VPRGALFRSLVTTNRPQLRALERNSMADKYSSFEELIRSEIEGRDFAVNLADRNTKILVIAPHAGAIEPGTSEITLAIAREELSYYLFEGTKDAGNGELHITSTNFDEPRALKMAEDSESIVAIHGEGSENDIVYLGGRNQDLRNHIRNSLKDAGFKTSKHDNPGLQGTSQKNICNRCASTSGVQLEVGKGLRKKFFSSLTSEGLKQTTEELVKFSNAVRKGLERANAL
jgi:phage replication-related protein YjqB (UPF0714/DUF867 family)